VTLTLTWTYIENERMFYSPLSPNLSIRGEGDEMTRSFFEEKNYTRSKFNRFGPEGPSIVFFFPLPRSFIERYTGERSRWGGASLVSLSHGGGYRPPPTCDLRGLRFLGMRIEELFRKCE